MKTQKATKERDLTAVLLIENGDPSFKNSSHTKHSFSKAFPKKKLICMHSEQRGAISIWISRHTKNPKESSKHGHQPFWAQKQNCRRPGKLQKTHSVIVKDVPRNVFTDSKMTALLHESFPEATVRRLVKKGKITLNTFKIDFPDRNDIERAITSRIFLNDQYFRANEFIEEKRIPIV